MTTRTNASTSTDDQKFDFSAVSGGAPGRSTAEDDVIVDGNIITAENYDSAAATATDDVWIDGNIITAENYDSAEIDQALTTADGQDGSDLLIWNNGDGSDFF